MLKQTIKFSFTGTLDNVCKAGERICAICAETPLPQNECHLVENAVVEALNNIIKHAYDDCPDGLIEGAISIFPDRVVIKLSHGGKRFQKGKRLSLEFDPDNVAGLPEGGMGLFIVNLVMDKTAYQVIDDKNVLTMTKLFKKTQREDVK